MDPDYLMKMISLELLNGIDDTHYEKIDLKVFVSVMPKEGWTRVAAPMDVRGRAHPSFGMTPTFREYSL